MSKACVGCKSLKYNHYNIPYGLHCSAVGTQLWNIRASTTIPDCPCQKCLIKIICNTGCEEFNIKASEYEKSLELLP